MKRPRDLNRFVTSTLNILLAVIWTIRSEVGTVPPLSARSTCNWLDTAECPRSAKMDCKPSPHNSVTACLIHAKLSNLRPRPLSQVDVGLSRKSIRQPEPNTQPQ